MGKIRGALQSGVPFQRRLTLFVEHGLSPEPGIERWQHRLTPIWCHVAGGCHLDRKMDDLIRSAGFDLIELRTEYASGPRPMTYMYLGRASRH